MIVRAVRPDIQVLLETCYKPSFLPLFADIMVHATSEVYLCTSSEKRKSNEPLIFFRLSIMCNKIDYKVDQKL